MSKKKVTARQVMVWLQEQDGFTLNAVARYAKALGETKQAADDLSYCDEDF